MANRYSSIRLEKGMYEEEGKTFSQILESLDPSEAYYGTPLEGLDAFQRQLKRFDIKVRGENSDTVEKFFCTSDGSVLFPEYVSRVVCKGMEGSDTAKNIAASSTNIDSAKAMESKVKLHKRGRMLVCSYEAVRCQKLDLFSVTLRQIGAHIARAHLEDAVDVLINGDGSSSPAQVTAAGSPFDYDALVDFWAKFDPYAMDTLLVSGDVVLQLLKMTQFQNSVTALNFQGTRQFVTSLGTTLLKTSVLPEKTAIGLDKRFALEMVRSGGVMVDHDKLIDRKFERAAITSIAGFKKVFPDASKVLKIR